LSLCSNLQLPQKYCSVYTIFRPRATHTYLACLLCSFRKNIVQSIQYFVPEPPISRMALNYFSQRFHVIQHPLRNVHRFIYLNNYTTWSKSWRIFLLYVSWFKMSMSTILLLVSPSVALINNI
jgi:hypothetical protein